MMRSSKFKPFNSNVLYVDGKFVTKKKRFNTQTRTHSSNKVLMGTLYSLAICIYLFVNKTIALIFSTCICPILIWKYANLDSEEELERKIEFVNSEPPSKPEAKIEEQIAVAPKKTSESVSGEYQKAWRPVARKDQKWNPVTDKKPDEKLVPLEFSPEDFMAPSDERLPQRDEPYQQKELFTEPEFL